MPLPSLVCVDSSPTERTDSAVNYTSVELLSDSDFACWLSVDLLISELMYAESTLLALEFDIEGAYDEEANFVCCFMLFWPWTTLGLSNPCCRIWVSSSISYSVWPSGANRVLCRNCTTRRLLASVADYVLSPSNTSSSITSTFLGFVALCSQLSSFQRSASHSPPFYVSLICCSRPLSLNLFRAYVDADFSPCRFSFGGSCCQKCWNLTTISYFGTQPSISIIPLSSVSRSDRRGGLLLLRRPCSSHFLLAFWMNSSL